MTSGPDRRAFFEQVGLALTAGLVACGGGTASGSAGTARRRIERIGLQLYTVRSAMRVDAEATLARVAEVGYREVEFAGWFDRSPAWWRSTLDALGLAAPSCHVGLDALRADRDRVFSDAVTLGNQWVVVPSLAEADRATLDAWRRTADELNELGVAARAAGLRLGYHNHDVELHPLEGRIPYDLLLESTDATLVDLEMDLYWMAEGGGDAVRTMTRWPGRFPLLHVKDRDRSGSMVDVGAGRLDFAGIFAHADTAGTRHWFVEHDQPGEDPFPSIEASFRHLSTLEY